MKSTEPSQHLCIISQDTCYKPVCLYDKNGLQIWAFFEWSDKKSLSNVVFCQLDGDHQVSYAHFQKDGSFLIKLESNVKPLKVFSLKNKLLVKDQEYPVIIHLNQEKEMDDPIDGGVIIRHKP
ncbi:hypothetical protein [Nonlabens antarcticus]|uniref:hypothetical protein n=1 Tax=Nonlabens antarcticus TaxID=392714 RepID=UPI001891CFB6|nr:hypothetical protein [Nonlabens antarcticus]